MNTRVSTAPLCEVAVFLRGQRTDYSTPTRVPREDALFMIANGIARWKNQRRQSIILLLEDLPAHLRDLSAVMGPDVTFNAAAGSAHHISLVEGWAS